MDSRIALAALAGRVPDYAAGLRSAGFDSGLAHDDWIADACSAEHLSIHKRYLVEYAGEVLAASKPSTILHSDELDCRSDWMNELKRRRRREHGDVDALTRSPARRHLVELSPGLREFIRVRLSSRAEDRSQAARQGEVHAQRRHAEMTRHRAAIDDLGAGMRPLDGPLTLRHQLSAWLSDAFASHGMQRGETLMRNQVLQRDEPVPANYLPVADGRWLVIQPSAHVSMSEDGRRLAGTMGFGFRLISPEAFHAPRFVFGRDLVIQLAELLPSRMESYGAFEGPEDVCLNYLAWRAALQMVLSDAISVLR